MKSFLRDLCSTTVAKSTCGFAACFSEMNWKPWSKSVLTSSFLHGPCSYLFSSYIHSICVPQPSRACGTFRRDLTDMLLHEGLEAVANECPNELSFDAWNTYFRTLVQICCPTISSNHCMPKEILRLTLLACISERNCSLLLASILQS